MITTETLPPTAATKMHGWPWLPIASGTRGDVQPYVALARALLDQGEAVLLSTHREFFPLLAAHRVPGLELPGEVQRLVQSPAVRQALHRGDFLAVSRLTRPYLREQAVQSARALAAVAGQCRAVVAGLGGLFSGLAIAEAFDLPLYQAFVTPFTPTRQALSPILPPGWQWLPGPMRRASHHLLRQAIWQMGAEADRLFRRELGLPHLPLWGTFPEKRRRHPLCLYGLSPRL